jgi:hypothetical protein
LLEIQVLLDWTYRRFGEAHSTRLQFRKKDLETGDNDLVVVVVVAVVVTVVTAAVVVVAASVVVAIIIIIIIIIISLVTGLFFLAILPNQQ